MKKILIAFLVGSLSLAGCGKKEDATPLYSSFTPIAGTFSVSQSGAAGNNLSGLTLKIVIRPGSSQDIYEFHGYLNGRQGVDVAFFVDSKRAGNGPWISTVVLTTFYAYEFANPIGADYTGTGTLSGNGSTFTAHFAGTSASGTLK